MLQNVTSLRKSAPWPLNISDEHVSCTAPATRNASLQRTCKCPTPAIVFGTATKPSRFAHFWRGAESLAPATQKHIWTLKNGPSMWCLYVFPTFWLGNVLRTTTAYTFWTSQLPKVLWKWCVLYILTWTCASRHNRVHFLNISTSKSALNMKCFETFWLGNVLRATTACTFSTSQLPKVIRTWSVLYILTWKCASRHNGVQFFISHMTTWLRTRRFSRPPEATSHWKNHSESRLSYLFAHLDLLSSELRFFDLIVSSLPFSALPFPSLPFLLFSSLPFSSLLWLFPSLPFIWPYCRKFDF